jgi:hypothetical protein
VNEVVNLLFERKGKCSVFLADVLLSAKRQKKCARGRIFLILCLISNEAANFTI